jgi:hypothetical protein
MIKNKELGTLTITKTKVARITSTGPKHIDSRMVATSISPPPTRASTFVDGCTSVYSPPGGSANFVDYITGGCNFDLHGREYVVIALPFENCCFSLLLFRSLAKWCSARHTVGKK